MNFNFIVLYESFCRYYLFYGKRRRAAAIEVWSNKSVIFQSAILLECAILIKVTEEQLYLLHLQYFLTGF